MSENKKTKRKSRVLVASCLLAALIVGSSTFAWFTSKDEVTNKLSAVNNYDVVAVEDFVPPDNWEPGQKVEKDVRTTNTGNIDAFVKVNLTSDMYLTKFDTSTAVTAANKSTVLPKGLELTNAAEKIRSKMAGSRLIYKPDAVAATNGYTYNESDLQNGGVTVDLNNSEAVNVDSSSATEFAPTSNGYYIFARSTTESSADGTTTKVLYDGFYYDSTSGKCYDIEVTPDASSIYKITAKIRQTKAVFVNNDQDRILCHPVG